MSEHFVTVHVDAAHLDQLARFRPVTDADRADAYAATIECSDPAACDGWIECDKDHDGYDPEDETSPAYDEFEDVMIHGVPHDWHYGWTVPYAGCPVVGSCHLGWDVPEGIPMDRPGRYLVDDEWDDSLVSLTLVREVQS